MVILTVLTFSMVAFMPYKTKTLSKKNTNLLMDQRQMTTNTIIGDWFAAAYPVMDAITYNAYVDQYNNWELIADRQKLYGTDASGGVFQVASLPSRPRPVHK